MRYDSNLHIFPEQCVKHLKEKFHLGELNIRELMYVMKRIGIKTFKVHTNGSIYDVFLRRDVNGVQDFEFINTLVQHRKEKRIKDEWANEPITDYTPEMSDMKNASDELLRQDDVYINKNKNIKNNMKQDKKKLYESIIASVAKEVKKALNENKEDYSIAQKIFREITSDLDTECFLDIVWRDGENDSQTSYTLYSNGSFASTINKGSKKILSFEDKCFDGDIVFDTNSNIINNIMELEQSDSKKYGYIIFEKEKSIRSKIQPVYIFYIKLSDFGIEFIKSLMDKRDERFNRDKNQNADKLESKLSDLNVHGRMNKFLSKKYGLSNFAINDIRHMCYMFSCELLNFVENEKETDEFMPRSIYRRFGDKKSSDVSKKLEKAVFDIIEDLKNNKF